jgi:electron transfer flavoprotein alpha subunit
VSVLVVVEHDRGSMTEAARQALTAGRGLSADLGAAMEAVLVGEGGEKLVDEAAAYGAEVAHCVTHELLTDYGPDAWAESVAQLVAGVEPVAVTTTGTDRGNEVKAQLAARLDLPFVANCLEIRASGGDGDPWTITRVQWGGSLLEDVELTASCRLVSYAHHAVASEPVAEPAAAEVSELEPDLDPAVTVTMIRDRDVLSQGVTLATAPVVVGGGRGVGSAEGFGPLEELAAELGGIVGCSRAVTNNGWRPHTDQVGQTGTRIAPDLYIAAGISGAIQHWVGAMAAKRILAVNTDPEANMVTKADYAVIADLHHLVPAVTAEIRRRRAAGELGLTGS